MSPSVKRPLEDHGLDSNGILPELIGLLCHSGVWKYPDCLYLTFFSATLKLCITDNLTKLKPTLDILENKISCNRNRAISPCSIPHREVFHNGFIHVKTGRN